MSLYGYSYVNNRGERIESPLLRTQEVLRLYEAIRRGRHIDPLKVRALRDGTFQIMAGFHRAGIAFVPGYRKVPCVIEAVDEELQMILEDLFDDYPSGRKELYSPIDHRVFADWKVIRNKARWNLISREFDGTNKRVLDIGSYTGFFSREIARRKGIVTGVEIDDRRRRIARKLNTLLGFQAEYIGEDFHEIIRRTTFDCVLFFSVLHWMLKIGGIGGVRESLMLVSEATPVMFFDMGQSDQKSSKMKTAEWSHGLVITKDTIPGLITGNSKFTHFKRLGRANLGRDVFKFWRTR